MPRFFIDVSYHGAAYSGSQWQENAVTVQGVVEQALLTLSRESIVLTGSSRTDAGVHARQNFYHFDSNYLFVTKDVYRLNAILPNDIAVNAITPVAPTAHSRFDAVTREYAYHIYQQKNPFLYGTAYFYPYPLNMAALNIVAGLILGVHDFTSFCKRKTQVNNFNCHITQSCWQQNGDVLIYHVTGNRFLRGMVRALTATQLRVGRGILSITDFKAILEAKDCTKAYFNAPAHGLFLEKVSYPA